MKFKLIKESKDTKIEVENPGVLEVPKGKKVYDLPVSHFKKLIDKKGREKVIRAISNLQIWNKNDDPKIASWAKKMKKSLEGYGEKKESLKESVSSRYYFRIKSNKGTEDFYDMQDEGRAKRRFNDLKNEKDVEFVELYEVDVYDEELEYEVLLDSFYKGYGERKPKNESLKESSMVQSSNPKIQQLEKTIAGAGFQAYSLAHHPDIENLTENEIEMLNWVEMYLNKAEMALHGEL